MSNKCLNASENNNNCSTENSFKGYYINEKNPKSQFFNIKVIQYMTQPTMEIVIMLSCNI